MATSQSPPSAEQDRSRAWMMGLLTILLMATFLNYANRFAFTQNAVQIKEAFATDQEGYGRVEGWFGLGFAAGTLVFGILADVVSVRWLFPAVIVAWSTCGAATGLITTVAGLEVCRFLLGMFEAGHWPCSLRTTQRTFKPAERTWANSILQSGASLGAVATPMIVLGLYQTDPSLWRWIFYIVGGLGIPWAIIWFTLVSEADVRRPVYQTNEAAAGRGDDQQLQERPLIEIFLSHRWWLLLAVVISINTFWHFIRVWMVPLLELDHGYDHGFVQKFTSVYYLATFFGALACGSATVRLAKRGWNVHTARMTTFFGFALLSTLAIPAAFSSRGWILLGLLLIVAFGSLGLFPIYYSLNQELSGKHQGKVGGSLGAVTWAVFFFLHPWIGNLVETYPTVSQLVSRYPLLGQVGLASLVGSETLTRSVLFAGVAMGPLFAWFVLWAFWGTRTPRMPAKS